jgi:tetratricopeptide (TPR) repeat protein
LAPHIKAPADESPLSAAATVATRRAQLKDENTPAARGLLIEALIALAEEELARGREAATIDALAEAGALFSDPLPDDARWRGRSVMLNRTKGALAQKQDRHTDAVGAFKAALSVIPNAAASAGRDDNAARLQLLVRLARSRLALGDAASVEAEMRECTALMNALEGKIPARALDTIRAAVLGNAGVAEAMLGNARAAEAKLAESIAVIDRLNAPELADLRGQILSAWADVLRRSGGDAEALLARRAPEDHVHDENCGCGHAHHHHGHSYASAPRSAHPR